MLVLGMQDSRDPAGAQDRRLTAEPRAGFSVSHVVCVAEIHFFGDWVFGSHGEVLSQGAC